MGIISKNQLLRLNPFLGLSFNNITITNFDYHHINTFPVNILVLVLKDNGQRRDYVEDRLNGQRYYLTRNHICFMPADLEIDFQLTPGVTFIALHFNLEYLYGMDIFSGTKHCSFFYDPKTVDKFRQILEDKDELRLFCALKAGLMNFCLSLWPKIPDSRMVVAQKYEPIFRYIYEHGDATLTVGKLAEIFGQTQDIFSRNFIRDLHQSPKSYLQRELLKKCVAFLLMPRITVKQTAFKLGFSSEFYLSRFFKKHMSISPSEYQNRFRR
jgi:AraC-like DNA-binding protein